MWSGCQWVRTMWRRSLGLVPIRSIDAKTRFALIRPVVSLAICVVVAALALVIALWER